jgi:hypothetical protein
MARNHLHVVKQQRLHEHSVRLQCDESNDGFGRACDEERGVKTRSQLLSSVYTSDVMVEVRAF